MFLDDYDSKSYNASVSLGFYSMTNPLKEDFSIYHMLDVGVMSCLGYKWRHVEAIDCQNKFYGIFTDDKIHIAKSFKIFDTKGKYTYYTIPTTQEKYEKFFRFFIENEDRLVYSNNPLYVYGFLNHSEQYVHCSSLIFRALIFSGILRHNGLDNTLTVTPDILHKILLDENILVVGSNRVKKLRNLERLNYENNNQNYVIDIENS